MKNKGITLLALIVTVIIMIILAGVTINLVNDGGAIQKTKEAVNSYNEASEIEELELAKVAATDYMTGEVDKDILEENLPEGWTVDNDWDGTIKCISPSGKEFSGIGTSEFTVEIKDKFGNKYKYYRLDKVTDEQRKKCKEQGIPMLLGDTTLDGKITMEDANLISELVAGLETEENRVRDILADIDNDEEITGSDAGEIRKWIQLDLWRNMRIRAIEKDSEIDVSKILEDDQTGKLYFIEENVTKEEADELEKYGVNRTLMGDMNLDGKLSQEDVDIMQQITGFTTSATDIQKKVGDLNGDKNINILDVGELKVKIK